MTAMEITPTVRACVVEPDEEASADLAHLLDLLGHKTYQTTSGVLGGFIADQIKLSVMVIDVLAPGGLDLIKQMHAKAPDVRLVAVSNGGRAGIPLFLELAHYAGADAALSVPVSHEALCAALHEPRPVISA